MTASATTRRTVRIAAASGDEAVDRKALWVLATWLSAADADVVVSADPEEADVSYGTGGRVAYPAQLHAWGIERTPPVGDPVAESFWWLARVEELAAHRSGDTSAFDEHGRFRFAASALAAIPPDERLTHAPVDLHADLLLGQLGLAPRTWGPEDAPYAIVLTHDIDVPRRWDRVGMRRALSALKRQLRRGDIRLFLETIGALVLLPFAKLTGGDPYTNGRRIGRLEAQHGMRSTSYIISRHEAPADGRLLTYRRGIRRYVRQVAETGGELGLHGSYTVTEGLPDDVSSRLETELELARQIAPTVTRHHRFHYLRHRPVEHWPALATAGIKSDASLGYAEQPGFRAGWSRPYQAWDHTADHALNLTIIPMAFMDATLEARYLNLPPSRATPLIDELLDYARANGSCFSVLWHNDKLCTLGAGGFTQLYRHTLRAIATHTGSGCAVTDVVESGDNS